MVSSGGIERCGAASKTKGTSGMRNLERLDRKQRRGRTCGFIRTVLVGANLLEQENEKLHLNPRFTSLLEPFVPKPATPISTEPVSA